jgi:aspartate/tyrosine/aromatic aminotransferase
MPYFEFIELLPDDPIFNLTNVYAADPRPNKVNLGIGTYKDSEGKPFVLNCVKKAESILLSKNLNKEYLPIEGHPEFIKESLKLVFGPDIQGIAPERFFAAQTVGGTGALRLGGDLFVQETSRTIFLPQPSWLNHKSIFTRAGLKIHFYRYYDVTTHRLDFASMCDDIHSMPPGSVILLHACCHNPTGMDPTMDQWKELSSLIQKQNVIPFFDFAYQGFSANLDDDARPVRYFASQGHEMVVSSSNSKNFGLYGERVGTLFAITRGKETTRKLASQLKQCIRGTYSTPPMHGARIVAAILQSETLKTEWMQELKNMRERIKEMRKTLVAGLLAEGRDWSFLGQQNGFFSYCGLSQDQTDLLQKKYGIYMPVDGRINVGGLNGNNLKYVIEAIVAVTTS